MGALRVSLSGQELINTPRLNKRSGSRRSETVRRGSRTKLRSPVRSRRTSGSRCTCRTNRHEIHRETNHAHIDRGVLESKSTRSATKIPTESVFVDLKLMPAAFL